MLDKLIRGFATIAAAALAAGAAGCNGMTVNVDDDHGVPLAKLDLSGAAPHEVVLAGPDHVKITRAAKLAITVDGDADAKDQLRFSLHDGKLQISRKHWKLGESGGTATVNVAMPPPAKLTMAGSGVIDADQLSGADAELTIAGSGMINAPAIDSDELSVTVAGSGSTRGGGKAKRLKSTIAGSGNADLAALKVDGADVTIAGSGNARFASDGEVKATIIGSGEVRVSGHARCTMKSMGSGRLVCETPVQTAKDE